MQKLTPEQNNELRLMVTYHLQGIINNFEAVKAEFLKQVQEDPADAVEWRGKNITEFRHRSIHAETVLEQLKSQKNIPDFLNLTLESFKNRLLACPWNSVSSDPFVQAAQKARANALAGFIEELQNLIDRIDTKIKSPSFHK